MGPNHNSSITIRALPIVGGRVAEPEPGPIRRTGIRARDGPRWEGIGWGPHTLPNPVQIVLDGRSREGWQIVTSGIRRGTSGRPTGPQAYIVSRYRANRTDVRG